MLIKNVYTEQREYPELSLKLTPGDIADISNFTNKQITDCQSLQSDFTRGYCICIGMKTSQKEQQGFKIDGKPKQETLRPISLSKRESVTKDTLSKPPQRKMIPVIEEDPKNQLVIVNDNGVVAIEKAFKTMIDLEPFRQSIKTNEHYELPTAETEAQEEVKQILERLKDEDYEPKPLCSGLNRFGKGCNHHAVKGYKYCPKHMPEEDRIDFFNNNKEAVLKRRESRKKQLNTKAWPFTDEEEE